MSWTQVTFFKIDQEDEETWPDQQEDKDKNKDKGQGIGSDLVI